MKAAALCADIGTSSLKAALIDFEGRELAFDRQAYGAGTSCGKTVSAGDWESAFEQAVRRLLSRSGAPAPRSVCLSGNGPTLVPVTGGRKALLPRYWYDRPARMPSGTSFFLPQALALLQERPKDYKQCEMLFSAPEWLSFQLGAEPVTALPAPAFAPYYWDPEQCAAAGLDMKKFPPFAPMGSRIGRVSSGAAARFGLPEGIPIVAGGPDFITALLGAGALEAGMVCDRAGTSEGINLCSPAPAAAGRGLRVLPHLSEGLWNIGAVIPCSGGIFEWYRNLTGQENRPYEDILHDIISSDNKVSDPCSGVFFNPPPSGAALDVHCIGISDKAKLGGGVLEALGFTVRKALNLLEQQGFAITEMRVSGGQGKNSRWNQLKADITGCALLIPETVDGELAGDAALAALDAGEASSLKQAAERMVRIKQRFEPDKERHARYRAHYNGYHEARRFFGLEQGNCKGKYT
ncbi:MAG: FGGY-family carbohydrate kinase [Spirochaetaceae bacterium]|jgi:xylulokinase|nr:FGGY-family carbohydrate kinase [Spirochaetaceae bacterium]